MKIVYTRKKKKKSREWRKMGEGVGVERRREEIRLVSEEIYSHLFDI